MRLPLPAPLSPLTPSVLRRRQTTPGTAVRACAPLVWLRTASPWLVLHLPRSHGHLDGRHDARHAPRRPNGVAARRRLPPSPSLAESTSPRHHHFACQLVLLPLAPIEGATSPARADRTPPPFSPTPASSAPRGAPTSTPPWSK